ncbi:hypothetical protein [Nocardia sp. NPDC052566]|uniref:hypothetical protein n=1 Tax=Nocardia sp. NPDC052566 TaxID=3364330 RepID=UPI0037C7F9DE
MIGDDAAGGRAWRESLTSGDAARRTYAPLPDGRIPLRVVLAVGDQGHAVTPWHDTESPMLVSVAEIARDCGMPENEVVGRELTARGDAQELHDFRLVHDPRL